MSTNCRILIKGKIRESKEVVLSKWQEEYENSAVGVHNKNIIPNIHFVYRNKKRETNYYVTGYLAVTTQRPKILLKKKLIVFAAENGIRIAA